MMEKLSPIRRFFKLLEIDRKDILYIYIYAIFSGLITLAIPLGVQAIIGLIAGGGISASLLVLILLVTLATSMSGVLKVMQLTVSETIQRRIFVRSSFDLAFRTPRLRSEALTGSYPPELMNRFFDTLTLQKGLPKLLMDFSSAILQILFGLLLISFYHPFFVFFGIILVLLLLGIIRFTGPGGLQTSLKESKYKYQVAHWLQEMARAMTTFKLSGSNNYPLRRTDSLVSNYLENRKAHFKILLIQYGSVVGFKTVVTAGLLALGSYLVIQNQLNIGQFVAAEIVVLLIMTSVEKLIVSMDTVYDVLTALEKLGTITDLPMEREGGIDPRENCPSCGTEIELNNLSLQFPDASQPTLQDINLYVKPGEKLCISGYNRAGKSTLLKMLAGLYTDFNGHLSFDGFPMHSLNLDDLRASIGDFCSEEDIFKGSILENITMGLEDISVPEVMKVVKLVGLEDYVRRQPDGLNALLLPQGLNIPGSIRTKIMISRAIIQRPRLLVLENPLRKLDWADRARIIEALTGKDVPWTLVTVSDDPMLAQACDRIVVMEQGKIITEGNFREILDSKHFRSIFQTHIPEKQIS